MPEAGPEPVPDVSEDARGTDVHGKDAAEVTDPGTKPDPGMEVIGHDKNVRDPAQAGDTAVTPDKGTPKSGGGCTAGKGPSSGVFLILLLIFGLLVYRKHEKT